MKTPQQRVLQYAQRKRAGRKNISLPGGISSRARQKYKSISRTKKNRSPREPAQLIDYAHHRALHEKKAARYRRIDTILDKLSLRNPLKRQAIHTACEEIVQKVQDINEQITDYQARLAEWKAKYNLVTHPEKYDAEKYPHLLKAYGVRKEDTAADFKSQIVFLEKRIQTAEKEQSELFYQTPLPFETIFGKNAATALWVELFRKHVFSTEHLE